MAMNSWVLLLLGFTLWPMLHDLRSVACMDLRLMPLLEQEFRRLVVDSEIAELCFNGSTAEIVDDRQEASNRDGTHVLLRVYRFARNAHGEYFFCILEGTGSPFFKHVSQAHAKAVLGAKYRAPALAIS